MWMGQQQQQQRQDGGTGSLRLSRTLSDVAMNRAVSSLYARMKLVDVGLQVKKRRKARRRGGMGEATSASGGGGTVV